VPKGGKKKNIAAAQGGKKTAGLMEGNVPFCGRGGKKKRFLVLGKGEGGGGQTESDAEWESLWVGQGKGKKGKWRGNPKEGKKKKKKKKKRGEKCLPGLTRRRGPTKKRPWTS